MGKKMKANYAAAVLASLSGALVPKKKRLTSAEQRELNLARKRAKKNKGK